MQKHIDSRYVETMTMHQENSIISIQQTFWL